jgi:hypothetical protein
MIEMVINLNGECEINPNEKFARKECNPFKKVSQ